MMVSYSSRKTKSYVSDHIEAEKIEVEEPVKKAKGVLL
jgi:hypothetical protein